MIPLVDHQVQASLGILLAVLPPKGVFELLILLSNLFNKGVESDDDVVILCPSEALRNPEAPPRLVNGTQVGHRRVTFVAHVTCFASVEPIALVTPQLVVAGQYFSEGLAGGHHDTPVVQLLREALRDGVENPLYGRHAHQG